jgi:hypothetical protein
MIKRIVVSHNRTQYATFVRNRKWDANESGCYVAGDPSPCYGLPHNTPVYWLEGWSENLKLNSVDVDFLKHRFHNHKFISEEKIHYEGIMF